MNTSNQHLVVYTMGKVGTDSVVKALEHNSFIVHKVHALWPPTVRDLNSGDRVDKPSRNAKHFLDKIAPGLDKIRMITLVREPVGRSVSGFFQQLGQYGFVPPYDNVDIDSLIHTFLTDRNHQRPDNWFEKEFSQVMGFDYRDIEFNPVRGHTTISTDHHDVLLLQSEIGNKRKKRVIGRFVGEELEILGKANTADRKPYAELHKEFVSRIEYSEAFLDDVLSLDTSRLFYSDDQREHIRNYYMQRNPSLNPLPRA